MKTTGHITAPFLMGVALLVPALAFAHEGHDHSAAGAKASTSLKAGPASVSADAHAQAEAGNRNEGDAARKARMPERMKGWAEGAIDARIAALSRAEDRIDASVKLSADAKASLKANLNSAADSLASLKGKVSADTSLADLKADASTIGKDFRVYLLVLPQTAIAAASDRELAIAAQLEALSVKFDARIDAAESAGDDVSSLRDALSDLNERVASAKVDAAAAASLAADLDPDQGDTAEFEANLKALKDARAKLQEAREDLKEAQADARTIVEGVKGKGSAEASASAQ